jgi:O-antigen/teichoic acid export membrane protein
VIQDYPAPPPVPEGWFVRAQRWATVAAQFFSVHVILQVTALGAGLLFTNFLSIEQFAVYTVASSILVTYGFATDLGSSSALLHFYHQGTRGVESYEAMARAVLSLRWWLYIIGAPIAVIVMVRWGMTTTQTATEVAALTVLLLAIVWWQVIGTTRLQDLRLRGQFGESYRAEIAGALARVAMAAAVVGLGARNATAAAATALLGAAVTAWWARGAFDGKPVGPSTPATRRAVVRYLTPTLPSAIYFMIQGQFIVWFAAIFGGLQEVANVGALGRLTLVVGVFGGLTQVVFLPRLAGMADERLFRRRFFQFGAILTLLAGGMVVAALLAPGVFLFVLGSSYQSLTHELLLMMASASLGLVGGYVVAVNGARSWNRWQPAGLVVLIVCQVVLAFNLPLHTTAGALWFGVGSATVGFLVQAVIVTAGLVQPRLVKW